MFLKFLLQSDNKLLESEKQKKKAFYFKDERSYTTWYVNLSAQWARMHRNTDQRELPLPTIIYSLSLTLDTGSVRIKHPSIFPLCCYKNMSVSFISWHCRELWRTFWRTFWKQLLTVFMKKTTLSGRKLRMLVIFILFHVFLSHFRHRCVSKSPENKEWLKIRF